MNDPWIQSFPGTIGSGPIGYWMQAAVRVQDNPALNLAIDLAHRSSKPLAIFFILDLGYPQGNLRSFSFLLQGVQDAQNRLQDLGLTLHILEGNPAQVLSQAAGYFSQVVTDTGVMPIQRLWRSQAAGALDCNFHIVETETSVPLNVVSNKSEWSAATLRRKLVPLLAFYAQPQDLPPHRPGPGTLPRAWSGLIRSSDQALDRVIHRFSQGPAEPVLLRGGESAALNVLEDFAEGKLDGYAVNRNNPVLGTTSGLSPYLHFGHISPRTVRTRILKEPQGENSEAFLEELIVRRELSFNYLWFNPSAGLWEGLPQWARRTLEAHSQDPRDYNYSLTQWEQAKTHDRAWNAAQYQLLTTGTIAGYMRMYWGKKFLEWTEDPEQALKMALEINDRWALDGRDPNSVAGVLWCFGLHDRPWVERKVFGMVRYMNEAGLRRKFDLEAYIRKWTPGEKDPQEKLFPV